jgi:hypothetical protein
MVEDHDSDIVLIVLLPVVLPTLNAGQCSAHVDSHNSIIEGNLEGNMIIERKQGILPMFPNS